MFVKYCVVSLTILVSGLYGMEEYGDLARNNDFLLEIKNEDVAKRYKSITEKYENADRWMRVKFSKGNIKANKIKNQDFKPILKLLLSIEQAQQKYKATKTIVDLPENVKVIFIRLEMEEKVSVSEVQKTCMQSPYVFSFRVGCWNIEEFLESVKKESSQQLQEQEGTGVLMEGLSSMNISSYDKR